MTTKPKTLNLDDFAAGEVKFTYCEKEYAVKKLTYGEYKTASQLFKDLGDNPGFEDIEKVIKFVVPDLSQEDIEKMDISQITKLITYISEQLMK